MTVKQQKIGLLSSSTEESALAVSLPQLYQITSNALLRLAACMHYQPSISPDRLHFQVDQSYFPPLTFFLSSLSKNSKLAQALIFSFLLQYQCRWHTCKLTVIHGVKVLNVKLGWENAQTNVSTVSLQQDGNVFPFAFSVLSELQWNKRTHINEISPFQSVFHTFLLTHTVHAYRL